MLEQILPAFLIGGLICVVAQLAMDLTPFVITPAHVLVTYVVSGALISALGFYQPLVDFAGAGATVPLLNFGHVLAQGTIEAVNTEGFMGVFTGGLGATSGIITVAIILGFTMATLFNPRG